MPVMRHDAASSSSSAASRALSAATELRNSSRSTVKTMLRRMTPPMIMYDPKNQAALPSMTSSLTPKRTRVSSHHAHTSLPLPRDLPPPPIISHLKRERVSCDAHESPVAICIVDKQDRGCIRQQALASVTCVTYIQ